MRTGPRRSLDSGPQSRLYGRGHAGTMPVRPEERPMDQPRTTPIACDMTDAPDTPEERIAEYDRLFSRTFVGRERTPAGIRFRLRADDGVEAWVRDLAAREQACC